MITLVYGSSATEEMSEEKLLELLRVSHSNNRAKNITGILLYRGGNFLQVLEGEEAEVEALYEKIKADKRHSNVITIFKRPIKQREFDDWEMGFVNFDSLREDEIPEGYSDFLIEPINDVESDTLLSHVSVFTKNFRDLMR